MRYQSLTSTSSTKTPCTLDGCIAIITSTIASTIVVQLLAEPRSPIFYLSWRLSNAPPN